MAVDQHARIPPADPRVALKHFHEEGNGGVLWLSDKFSLLSLLSLSRFFVGQSWIRCSPSTSPREAP